MLIGERERNGGMGKQIVVVVVGLMGQKGRTDCEARWEIRCDGRSVPDALESIRYFRNVCGTRFSVPRISIYVLWIWLLIIFTNSSNGFVQMVCTNDVHLRISVV